MAAGAIATVISGAGYLPLLLAWLHSVARVYHAYPGTNVVIMHCDVDPAALKAIVDCAHVDFPAVNITLVHGCMDHPSRLHPIMQRAIARNDAVMMRYLRTFSIYRLWSLTEYDRVLFMDVDTLALKAVPDVVEPQLSDGRQHAAVECVKIERVDTCNTGVLIIYPSAQLYADLVRALGMVAAERLFLLSDQAFFTTFFADCVRLLPRTYNWLAMLRSANWPWREGMERAFILHFRSTKFKPIKLQESNALAYNPRNPSHFFRTFHDDFAPMHACYNRSMQAGRAPDIFRLRPLASTRQQRLLSDMDEQARRAALRNKTSTRGVGILRSDKSFLEEGYRRTPAVIRDYRCKPARGLGGVAAR